MKEERFQFLPGQKPGPTINIIFNYASPNLTRDKIQYELAQAIDQFREFLELVEAPKTHIQETTGRVVIEDRPNYPGGITWPILDSTKEYTWECSVPLRGKELYNLVHEVAGHGCFIGMVGNNHRYIEKESEDPLPKSIKEGTAELIQLPDIPFRYKVFLKKCKKMQTLREIIYNKWTQDDVNYYWSYLMVRYMREHATHILKTLMNGFIEAKSEKIQQTLEEFAQAHNDSFHSWLNFIKQSNETEVVICPTRPTLSKSFAPSAFYSLPVQNNTVSHSAIPQKKPLILKKAPEKNYPPEHSQLQAFVSGRR